MYFGFDQSGGGRIANPWNDPALQERRAGDAGTERHLEGGIKRAIDRSLSFSLLLMARSPFPQP